MSESGNHIRRYERIAGSPTRSLHDGKYTFFLTSDSIEHKTRVACTLPPSSNLELIHFFSQPINYHPNVVAVHDITRLADGSSDPLTIVLDDAITLDMLQETNPTTPKEQIQEEENNPVAPAYRFLSLFITKAAFPRGLVLFPVLIVAGGGCNKVLFLLETPTEEGTPGVFTPWDPTPQEKSHIDTYRNKFTQHLATTTPVTNPYITVHDALPCDVETIANFQVAMAAETEHGLVLPIDTVLRGVRAVLVDSSKGKYFIAKTPDGKVVGCLLVTREWSDWRAGTVLWIQSVFVVPEFRGCGCFRLLYQRAQKMVLLEKDKDGYPYMGLRLYVETENERAMNVYTKMGMEKDRYVVMEWLTTSY
eukprot:PhF_6_TR19770/c0_g1_i3/m.28832